MRIRRVKCDEGRPSCNRCLKAGRNCDGYEVHTNSTTSHDIGSRITIYVPPIQKQPISSPGTHELDFYRFKAAAKLSGVLDSNFWTSLVLQLTDSEPTIQHAVTAISASLRELELAPSNPPFGIIPANSKMHEASFKAMRCLTTRMEADPYSYLVPLVACILFTCLEFIRGSVRTAMVHMLSGFKILETVQRFRPSQTEYDYIKGYLIPIFARLNILCILFRQSLSPLPLAPKQHDFQFSTIIEARETFYNVLAPILIFVRKAWELLGKSNIQLEDHMERCKLQHELEQWHCGLEHLVSSMASAGETKMGQAVNVLRIHYRVSRRSGLSNP